MRAAHAEYVSNCSFHEARSGGARGRRGEVGVAASGNASPLAPRSHTTFCLNPLMFII